MKEITSASTFQWKDQENNYHRVETMSTTHLFYTLRMIWNHTMPEQVGVNTKKYRFGPFYTEEYLKKAVKFIALELAARKDLPSNLKMELNEMFSYIIKFKLG